MKIRITKEFSFEMGHALDGYDGLCSNIHGHSYVLSVTIFGETIKDPSSTKLGMVLDFGDLKKIVKSVIIDKFDHALVLKRGYLKPEEYIVIENKMFERFVELDFQPTSENLIAYFADKIMQKLPANILLFSLKLRETATSFAEWYASDNK